MTSSLHAPQFAYKAWANAELLQALAQIDPDAYPAQRQRAIRLLNHAYVVDRIFAAHLDGRTHPFAASNTPQTPTLGALARPLSSPINGTRHIARLDAAALQQPLAFRFTDGDAGTMTREEMLFHLLAHGAYHRGNIACCSANAGLSSRANCSPGSCMRATPGVAARRAELAPRRRRSLRYCAGARTGSGTLHRSMCPAGRL